MQELNLALSALDPLKSLEPDNIHNLMISRLSNKDLIHDINFNPAAMKNSSGIIGRLQMVPLLSRLIDSYIPPIIGLQVDTLSAPLLIRDKNTFSTCTNLSQRRPHPNTSAGLDRDDVTLVLVLFTIFGRFLSLWT
ncbi:hypothetical protein CEXT_14321 [Caerostris extrusa]|uniref:Uncharacterized protein n=1 Tax=Caerostris extrusa TaxID=172846 RepID=A0AAV4PBG8_CAEEX|nr:hypothetical protein CEXT_14321 [Caerostris extrusa]